MVINRETKLCSDLDSKSANIDAVPPLPIPSVERSYGQAAAVEPSPNFVRKLATRCPCVVSYWALELK